MPFCPKCETEYRDGFETCADCDVALVASIEPAADLEDVEEDFAREMFAEDVEVTHACDTCETEFVEGGLVCTRCAMTGGGQVRSLERAEWVESLTRSQLFPWQEREPLENAEGLECVWVALDPAEAGFAATVLGGMGVSPAIGHDGLDDFEETSHVGIWVAAEEAEAARMLTPEDPSEWRDEGDVRAPDTDPYTELLRRAESYRGIRKYRHAVGLAARALEVNPERYEAYVILGRSAGEMGNYEIAAEAFGDAVERIGNGSAIGFELAAYSFLDAEGRSRFKGPVADRGYSELKAYLGHHERQIRAHLLFMEAAHERGASSVVAEVADHVDRINPGVLRLDGMFARMAGR